MIYSKGLIYPCVHRLSLILTKVYWTDHVHKLEITLNKLDKSGLKFNIKKYFFGQTETEYLGFWVTRDSVKPIDKNTSNKKYYATNFSKRSTLFYRFSELLS